MQKKIISLNKVFGVLCLAFASFCSLVILSFHPTDPSGFSSTLPWSGETQNIGGHLGAHLASTMIFLFGICSLLINLSLFVCGFKILKGASITDSIITTLKILTVAIVGLSFENTSFNLRVEGLEFPSTGAFSHQIESSIQSYIGLVGHLILAASLISLMFFDQILSIYAKGKLLISQESKKLLDNLKRKPVEKNSPTHPGENDNFIQKESLQSESLPTIISTHSPLPSAEEDLTPDREKRQYQTPSGNAFNISSSPSTRDKSQYQKISEKLVSTFEDFGIKGQVSDIEPGPSVTVFEYQASKGTKLSKMVGLSEDIALALRVDSIIITPVSGKNVVGVQIPNQMRETVLFGDVVKSPDFQKNGSPLTFAIGKDIKGDPICEDLRTMPHLLMAGQTGSGKSVAINSLLCSILMKSSPDEVRLILVDPKILELKVYEGVPHLLMPVITEADRASLALKWAVHEMERRYKLMERTKVRHLEGFNQAWTRLSESEKSRFDDLTEGQREGPLPYLLVVIDELADLMLSAPKDVENSIQRLAQKARACGIHLVLATQRPSVDVITGVIKANLPSRISFKVFSRGDSRTILDSMGAEKLLGKGDMLYLKPGVSKLRRIQGAFLDDDEVVKFIEDMCESSEPEYLQGAIDWIDNEACDKTAHSPSDTSDDDPKWDEALAIAQSQGHISASFLQRQLKIGYNRAARIVDSMTEQGLISHADGSKPRKWLGLS